MTKIDKLIEKIESRPFRKDVTFDELERYLSIFNIIRVRSKGSHVQFKTQSGQTFTIPNNLNPVKPAYVKLAVEFTSEFAHDED